MRRIPLIVKCNECRKAVLRYFTNNDYEMYGASIINCINCLGTLREPIPFSELGID